MKLSPTPLLPALLLVLQPALATAAETDISAADATDAPQSSQITRLPAVRATAGQELAARLDAWGGLALRDTPATVQVVDRQQLDTRQIRTLSELAREDAGLGDNYAPIGYYQNLAVRGYPLDLGTGYRGNGLAMTGEQRIALEDKQQVEVLKGLAGINAGVMEPGGVLNFISKRPTDVRQLTLGTDAEGSRYAALDVGGWLTPAFGLRGNLAWDNTHSHVRHADGQRRFHALALDWRITAATTLELDSNYQRSAQRSASGYQLLGGSMLPTDPDPEQMLGYQPWQQPVRIHASNTSARLKHALGDIWQLQASAARSRSVIDDNVAFAYGCYYTSACADGSVPGNAFAPNGDYDIYDYRSPDDTRTSDSARISISGSFGSSTVQHDLDFGANGFRRTITRRPYVYDYVGSANIHDPEPPIFAPSPNQPGTPVRRFDSRQTSLFVLDRMQLGAHWQLLLGGNWVKLDERAWSSSGNLKRSTRLEQMLPQAALLWQPSAALTTYASYSEGLSLGKEAPFWTSNDGEVLAPRLSRQWEVGSKYQVGEALDLSAAVFRIRQPYQFAQPDASSAGFSFVQRGEQVHGGLELVANGRLGERVGIHASVAMIRARAHATGTAAFEGHQLANVPLWRSSLHLDYQWLPQLAVQAGWRHAADNPATADGSVQAPAYDVFDAGLRWQARCRQHALTVQLSVDNLFNHAYWRDVGSSDGDSYLFPGTPRQLRMQLRIDL